MAHKFTRHVYKAWLEQNDRDLVRTARALAIDAKYGSRNLEMIIGWATYLCTSRRLVMARRGGRSADGA